MKSTIFAILVLVLMIGLTLVEMNANPQTQFQTLSDTEMLSTQGVGDGCEEYRITSEEHDFCASKACDTWWNGHGWSSSRRIGGDYAVCGVESSSKVICVVTDAYLQQCAEGRDYIGPHCQSWFMRPQTVRLWVSAVYNQSVSSC